MASPFFVTAAVIGMVLAGEAPSSEVLVAGGEPARRLLGDWETPDALVLAMTEPSDTHAALLFAAAREVETFVLAAPDDEADAVAWIADLQGEGRVGFLEAKLDSDWVRDFGPLQVEVDGEGLLWLDAAYYLDRPLDDRVPVVLSDALGVPVEPFDLPVEGGAIISNGEGLCATTLESFELFGLDPTDPDGRVVLDEVLAQLGCEAWALVPALLRDPTSHVDMLAQFLAPDVVLVAEIDPALAPDDAARLDEAARGLELAAEALGQALRVVRVPTPVDVERGLYFTYVNGTRLGSSFLVPSYEAVPGAEEDRAWAVLDRELRDVDIVPIPADEFIALNGAVHCLTLGLTLPSAGP